MTSRNGDKARTIALVGEGHDVDAVVEQIKEIENQDIAEPTEEAESEQVDGEQKQLDDWGEEKVEDDKYNRGHQIGWPSVVDFESTEEIPGYVEAGGRR